MKAPYSLIFQEGNGSAMLVAELHTPNPPMGARLVIMEQWRRNKCVPLPTEHAEHIIAEFSVTPDANLSP